MITISDNHLQRPAAARRPPTPQARDAARRMTRQRQVVLDVVRRLDTHPTADEVYDHVRRRLPRVSLATVYRNLETLSGQGLIHKIGHCDIQMRFEADLHPHLHLRCIDCGDLRDAPINPCGELDRAVKAMGASKVFGYRLEFLYRCPACRRHAAGRQRLRSNKASRSAAPANAKRFPR